MVGRLKKGANSTNADEPAAKISRVTSTKVELNVPVLPNVSGNLLVCGQGDMGQLGLGEDVQEKTRPAILATVKNVVDVRAGGMHSLCLTRNGEVWSFGCNDESALGRESSEEGSEFIPVKVKLPGPAVQISAGDSHSACLLSDGKVYAWGSFRDSHGSMGLTLDGNKKFPIEVLPGIKSVSIASGADHLAILTTTGKIYTVGCAEQGQLGRVSLRSASGESRRGKTELLKPGVVTTKRHQIADAIWATTYCTFYRDQNTKQIYAFGLNNYNQLCLAETSEPVFTPKLTKLENVKMIDGGQHHTLVLTNDNKCYVIGRKEYGRLGLGNVEADLEELSLIKSLSGKNIQYIACGDCNSFAITDDGKIYSWGMGNNLQLGLGSEDDAIEPTLLTGVQVKDKNVIRAAGGGQHSLFVVEAEVVNEPMNLDVAATETKVTKKKSAKEVTEVPEAGDGINVESKSIKEKKSTTKKNGVDDVQSSKVTTSSKIGRKKQLKEKE